MARLEEILSKPMDYLSAVIRAGLEAGPVHQKQQLGAALAAEADAKRAARLQSAILHAAGQCLVQGGGQAQGSG